jgi:glutamyl-tRNA synthetase
MEFGKEPGRVVSKVSVITRFAPSPTGDLHLGGAWTALASWALARSVGGRFVIRVEDIDTPRVVAGCEGRILEDLAWLGLHSDEVPCRQSERTELYEAALDKLMAEGRVYPCDCSRSEIARAASAPHPGEEVVYPGACRDKDPGRPMKRDPAYRFRVLPDDVVAFTDRIQGDFSSNIAGEAGDFVLRRGDGVFAYQLAVSVDDLAMGITDVVRGADLLGSTARQLLLMQTLACSRSPGWASRGIPLPRYAHVPMVTGPDGGRLAKRDGPATVRELREGGVAPGAIVGRLAAGLGLVDEESAMGSDKLAKILANTSISFAMRPWTVPPEWCKRS